MTGGGINPQKKEYKMKKILLAVTVAASSLGLLAADGGGMDTTQATTMMTQIQTGLEAILTAAGPIVTALILSGIGIWAVFAVVRLMKRAFNSGK